MQRKLYHQKTGEKLIHFLAVRYLSNVAALHWLMSKHADKETLKITSKELASGHRKECSMWTTQERSSNSLLSSCAFLSFMESSAFCLLFTCVGSWAFSGPGLLSALPLSDTGIAPFVFISLFIVHLALYGEEAVV